MTATLPLRGDNSVPDIGAFGIDHTGTQLVISSDSPTLAAYDLYLDPGGEPDRDEADEPRRRRQRELRAPAVLLARQQVGRVHRRVRDGRRQRADGDEDRRQRHAPAGRRRPVTNADAEWLQWSNDGTQIYAQGDLVVNNDTKLYRVDPTMTDQAPALAVRRYSTGGDVGERHFVRMIAP